MKTLSVLIILLLFSAQATLAQEASGVVVSIKPLHSLVQGVMGNTGTADLIVTGSTSLHGFQMKPSQIKSLHDARVIFYIDDQFELFLSKAFASLSPKVTKVPLANHADIVPLEYRKGNTWEADHHHDDEDHGNHEEHHEHEDSSAAKDFHIWLNPQNARIMVEIIAHNLSLVYPENKLIYEANARALSDRINAIDQKLKQDLAPVANKPFIVFHDAYQYFEKHYGLNGVGAITLEPNSAPSIQRIQELREIIKKTGAMCIFREPQFSDKLVHTVIENLSVKSGTLDPEATALAPGENLYFELLEGLGKSLKECLAKSGSVGDIS